MTRLRLTMSLLCSCALTILTFTAHADPGPQAYVTATSPLPRDEVATLTKKLEALSAKGSWEVASKLATEELGEAWCRDDVALPFRTFAALGVIARRSKGHELALTCTLRSFFAADSRIALGQSYFELSLLVDAMTSDEFVAFRERAYNFPSTGCDQDTACCYEINGFVQIINSFDRDFYGKPGSSEHPKKDTKEFEAQKQRSSTGLLELAYAYNPSPTLARRLVKRASPAKPRITGSISGMPAQLAALHTASSSKEAKSWLRAHARTHRRLLDEPASKLEVKSNKAASRDGVSVTQHIVGHIFDEECDYPMFYSQYVVVHVKGSSDHVIFLDPHDGYSANECGGYGDDYSIDAPKFQKQPGGRAPLLVISSATSFYINGTMCGASGANYTSYISCSIDAAQTPRCIHWSHSVPFETELDKESLPLASPVFRFRKGLSDFERSKHSSSVQALIKPLDGVTFMELYDGIPRANAEAMAWFKEAPEQAQPAREGAGP